MATDPITGTENVLDLRDITERIEELRAEFTEATGDDPDDYAMSDDDWLAGLAEADRDELVMLLAFVEEHGDSIEDWQYGATLIHEDHFEEYAQELAEDIGAVHRVTEWPTMFIDWEAAADALQQDYQAVELGGFTYWVR